MMGGSDVVLGGGARQVGLEVVARACEVVGGGASGWWVVVAGPVG